jgi:hypothetical protein
MPPRRSATKKNRFDFAGILPRVQLFGVLLIVHPPAGLKHQLTAARAPSCTTPAWMSQPGQRDATGSQSSTRQKAHDGGIPEETTKKSSRTCRPITPRKLVSSRLREMVD